ncbi:MAG: hypothetical protein ACI4F7_01250 [Acutalibacteraceae bacterium]
MVFKNCVDVFKKVGCLITVISFIALSGCKKSNDNANSDISSTYSKGNNTVVSENATSENNLKNDLTESGSAESEENISNANSVISKNETIITSEGENQNNNSSADKTVSETNNDSSKTEDVSNKYSKFDKQIGVYETKNLPSVSSYYDDRCPAWIGVYSIGKSEIIEKEIIEKFNVSFGYYANESVACSYVGRYTVDGYDEPKEIYQYTIQDLTYPLLDDEFYVITKKICDDGSAWVGFPVPGNLDTMDTSYRVSQLLNQMDQMFCEWTGYSMEYMRSNKDKFLIDMVSVAGKVRTKDGQVLDIVYRYTRGVNMPINN